MAAAIKSNKRELQLAKALPADEWFDIYHDAIKSVASYSYANGLMQRFKCVKQVRSVRVKYFVSSEDKERLIRCIENNPYNVEFDITKEDSNTDEMWHMLLGTRQGVRHEKN